MALKSVDVAFDVSEEMGRNFYFASDAKMASGSALFSARINADAASLGLTQSQALDYHAIDAALQEAMQLATTPATRAAVTVSLKNDAVRAMQRSAKNLATIIGTKEFVSDGDLISLGLLPRAKRRRRDAPEAPPSVKVKSVVGRVVTLRVYDPLTIGRRKKAFAAVGAEIFAFVGEEGPTSTSDYRFMMLATRTIATITFPNEVVSGATIWISARWTTRRGECSPASAPIRFTIQGGPVTAAADGLRLAA